MARRTERINHLIRNEISVLLHRQVKDPRLSGLITVTRVSVSPDLHRAKVFISVLGDDNQKDEVIHTLSAASGFFHKELRERLRLRYIPELAFYYDSTIEDAAAVLQLINEGTINSNSPNEY